MRRAPNVIHKLTTAANSASRRSDGGDTNVTHELYVVVKSFFALESWIIDKRCRINPVSNWLNCSRKRPTDVPFFIGSQLVTDLLSNFCVVLLASKRLVRESAKQAGAVSKDIYSVKVHLVKCLLELSIIL